MKHIEDLTGKDSTIDFEVSATDFRDLLGEDAERRKQVMEKLGVTEDMGPVTLGVLANGENSHGKTSEKIHRFTISTARESFGRIELD